MIIDIHSHIGDILYPNGGDLIYRKSVKKRLFFDIISLSESGLHAGVPGISDEWLYRFTFNGITKASRARNATATLENNRTSMDRTGVTHTVCMPIPPHVVFDDLRRARKADPGIIPFTGIDFKNLQNLQDTLKIDVEKGAMGLKLHPIIQKVPLNDKRTFQVVEAFAVHHLPVLFHCGISSYYLDQERETREDASYGNIGSAEKLVAAFPDVPFIAGHAGLFQYQEVIDRLSGYDNVHVDISFQSPSHIECLLRAFGPERILFASDWPYGRRTTAVNAVKKACNGDMGLENRILYQNARELLPI